MNYYNENNAHAAAWLHDLIKRGLIPDGVVDTRSIADVRADDLIGYDAVHLFAGIGGWPLALRLAGLPDDFRVWTGSCPCQPFSVAGKRKGTDDKRHLWPHMHRLISECNPAIVFGEQVASKDGRNWFSGVRTDLEGMDYAVGAADLCAAGVGAPHIRQRIFWMAHCVGFGYEGLQRRGCGELQEDGEVLGPRSRPERSLGNVLGMGVSEGEQRNGGREEGRGRPEPSDAGYWSDFAVAHFSDGKSRRIKPGLAPLAHGIPGRLGLLRGYGNAIVPPLAAEFITTSLQSIEDIQCKR